MNYSTDYEAIRNRRRVPCEDRWDGKEFKRPRKHSEWCDGCGKEFLPADYGCVVCCGGPTCVSLKEQANTILRKGGAKRKRK